MFSIGYDTAKCLSAAQVENLRHSKGSVSPQLESGRSLCSQAKWRSPTRHLLLTRESRFSALTSDDVAVCRVEFLGNKNTLKCFNSKLPLATKTGILCYFFLAV